MKVAMSSACKQAQPLLGFQGGIMLDPFNRPKDKVMFVMGATGTGKSRLAVDLAAHFPAEIINSDKMQVYKGLDIITNKITPRERRGVPHHLLGFVDPESDFTANDFRQHSCRAIESILSQGRLPIIAGGSNSFIDALVNDFRSRQNCCFLWVDVSPPVLHSLLSERVDRMVDSGLVEEVRDFYVPGADNTRGLRRAIGVSEMDEYLRAESTCNDGTKARLLEEAIGKIKENTCTLACRQLQKIHRLHEKWNRNMHRIDASEVFLRRGEAEEAEEAWERQVLRRSVVIVERFLLEEVEARARTANVIVPAIPMAAAVANVNRAGHRNGRSRGKRNRAGHRHGRSRGQRDPPNAGFVLDDPAADQVKEILILFAVCWVVRLAETEKLGIIIIIIKKEKECCGIP